jgi:uncharacterized protein YigE (DUF2233 family)
VPLLKFRKEKLMRQNQTKFFAGDCSKKRHKGTDILRYTFEAKRQNLKMKKKKKKKNSK